MRRIRKDIFTIGITTVRKYDRPTIYGTFISENLYTIGNEIIKLNMDRLNVEATNNALIRNGITDGELFIVKRHLKSREFRGFMSDEEPKFISSKKLKNSINSKSFEFKPEIIPLEKISSEAYVNRVNLNTFSDDEANNYINLFTARLGEEMFTVTDAGYCG
ncbi:hypothetical protein BCR32DRAFT_302141, partial [Anaeromyces robustus]